AARGQDPRVDHAAAGDLDPALGPAHPARLAARPGRGAAAYVALHRHVRRPVPNMASTNARIAPRRSAMVSPSSTARHSIWWNTGLWVASSASLRKHLPGLTTYRGSGRVSMDLIGTGEVCVRSTTPESVFAAPSGPATKNVSWVSRAGW